MAPHDSDSEISRLRRERDLYLQLLELGDEPDLQSLLQEALASIVSITGAERAYLEIGHGPTRRWALSDGLHSADLDTIRSVISSGVIAEALATGATIQTPSAMLDARFARQPSVRANRIEAVLCTPLGKHAQQGVLYLQGRSAGGRFPAADVELIERLARHIEPFIERLRLIEEQASKTDPTLRWRSELEADDFIGRSEAVAAILKEVALVAPRNIALLITGPSGTGKTALARMIHNNSPRKSGPFVEINCANLNESLADSELFGVMAGAHSTATKRSQGKVDAASGGTLFLDEVAELPLPVQAKLLQLLQSGQYYPVGSSRALLADIRIVAATNDDLDSRVRDKTFREDLFHRLNVLPIKLPGLAERSEDIEPLALFFCRQIGAAEAAPQQRLSHGALRALELADWPGNIRQLHNALHAGVIRALGEGSDTVERHHLFTDRLPTSASGDEGVDFHAATRSFQAGMLRDALTRCDWNVSEAARQLNLARSTMYNLIRALGLERT